MVKHVFFVLLVLIMQGTLFNSFDVNGILPNFSLIYLIYVGFFLELYTALVVAVLLGALIDMSGTFPAGTTVIIYALLVFVINYLSTFLDFRNLSSWMLGVIIGTSLIYFSYFIVAEMSFEFLLSFQQLTINFFIQLLYNLFGTLLFYPLYKIFDNRTQHNKTEESLLEV